MLHYVTLSLAGSINLNGGALWCTDAYQHISLSTLAVYIVQPEALKLKLGLNGPRSRMMADYCLYCSVHACQKIMSDGTVRSKF